MTFTDDAPDKPQACLNQTWAESDYLSQKIYYDTCIGWWEGMSPEQQAIGMAVLDAYSIDHPKASERIAADLPSAPKCPF